MRAKTQEQQPPPPESIESLLQYGAEVQSLDAEQLAAQYEQVLTVHREQPSSAAAIKLSLLLSRAGAHPTSLAEALELLASVGTEETSEGELARLLHAQVSERHRVEARLLDERARTARLSEALATARAAIDVTERERARLVRQLDALKAVEARIALDPN